MNFDDDDDSDFNVASAQSGKYVDEFMLGDILNFSFKINISYIYIK